MINELILQYYRKLPKYLNILLIVVISTLFPKQFSQHLCREIHKILLILPEKQQILICFGQLFSCSLNNNFLVIQITDCHHYLSKDLQCGLYILALCCMPQLIWHLHNSISLFLHFQVYFILFQLIIEVRIQSECNHLLHLLPSMFLKRNLQLHQYLSCTCQTSLLRCFYSNFQLFFYITVSLECFFPLIQSCEYFYLNIINIIFLYLMKQFPFYILIFIFIQEEKYKYLIIIN